MCKVERQLTMLHTIVKGFPFTYPRVLLLKPLLACCQITVLYPIHARICLEHQRLQDTLILDCLTWQHNLNKIQIFITTGSFSNEMAMLTELKVVF